MYRNKCYRLCFITLWLLAIFSPHSGISMIYPNQEGNTTLGEDTLTTEMEMEEAITAAQVETTTAPDTQSLLLTPSDIEESYFEFLTDLNAQSVKKSGGLLGRIGSSSEEFLAYKLQEYNSYLSIYFPNAHSDYVQDYVIQARVGKKEWGKFEIALIKFLYLYPNSSLKSSVLEMGIKTVQKEKYFKKTRSEVLALLSEVPISDSDSDRYFAFLSTIYTRDNLRSSSTFKKETWRFLEIYSGSPNAGTALNWLAELETANESFQHSLSMYKKLLALYPNNPEVSNALYQSGRIQQKRLNDYEGAITSFRAFLTQFPQDTLTLDVQVRIATIYDQNLNNWIGAIQEYEVLREQYPQAPQTIQGLLRIGEIQATKLNQRDEAIATYNQIASTYSDNQATAVEALQRAAKSFEADKEFEKAINQYMLIHYTYPGTADDLAMLEKCATLYEKKLKQKDKAIELLTMIVEQFPESKNAAKAEKRLKKLKK